MVPVIALVGHSNVGKSTLFNRLTKSRDALVADFPGLTRDRKYGKANFNNFDYIVIDTGGVDGDEIGIDSKMSEQTRLAIEEADFVYFLVDAKLGMSVSDELLADFLRKKNKPCALVINKTDCVDSEQIEHEYYRIGIDEKFLISAAHNRGLNRLISKTLTPFFESEIDDVEAMKINSDSTLLDGSLEDSLEERPIKIAIIGKPNVGKSTLINRILGEERVVVYDAPGTTRDSIYIPLERNDTNYILIDTAGIRRRKNIKQKVEKFSIVQTLKSIEDSNVVVFVVDARENITDQDLSLLGFSLNSGRSIVIAINKWDGLSQQKKESIKSEIDRRLGFVDFARIHFISALHGTGVGNLFASISEAFDSSTKRVSTSMLTKILKMATDDHQPPLIRSRRVKLKYAHAGGYNPPIIVIHGNLVKELPDSYKRYLMNYFRKTLEIVGTPIKIQFQNSENPYEKNLSDRRKRILRHLQNKKSRG